MSVRAQKVNAYHNSAFTFTHSSTIFILKHAAILSPIIVFFTWILNEKKHMADWHFWASNSFEYPQAIPTFISVINNYIDPAQTVFFLMILANIFIPYVAIYHKTKNTHAAIMYVYFSGVVFNLFDMGQLGQAIVHSFIALALISGPVLVIFFLIAQHLHREALGAVLLTIFYKSQEEYNANRTFKYI